jgi:hypothetical protein
LAAYPSANQIATSLRSLAFSLVSVPGLPSSLDQLADVGIQTNGQDNSFQDCKSG